MKYTEEQIKEVTSWIEENMKNYVDVTEEGDFGVDVERLIIDLKTHMRSDDYEPFDIDAVRLLNRRAMMKNGKKVRIVSFNMQGVILGLIKNPDGSESPVSFDRKGINLTSPSIDSPDPMCNLVLVPKKKFTKYISVNIRDGRGLNGKTTQTLQETKCYDKEEDVVGPFVGRLEWEGYN